MTTCICMCVSERVVYVSMWARTYGVCECVVVYEHACTFTSMCVCMCACMCVCVYARCKRQAHIRLWKKHPED